MGLDPALVPYKEEVCRQTCRQLAGLTANLKTKGFAVGGDSEYVDGTFDLRVFVAVYQTDMVAFSPIISQTSSKVCIHSTNPFSLLLNEYWRCSQACVHFSIDNPLEFRVGTCRLQLTTTPLPTYSGKAL